MDVFITGSTGFIGRATIAYLQGQGHKITALVRNTSKARRLLGPGVDILEHGLDEDNLVSALEGSDLVINLAGSPIATIWTRKRKRELRDSRVGITQLLVNSMKKCKNPPKLLISASAVGYYGNRKEEILTESSKPGTGFIPELCKEWEYSATEAESNGARVCLLRTGIVLGRESGMLNTMGQLFEMGLGIYIGSEQYVPWIHITDMVRIIGECIINESLSGPINCTAPSPVRNKEFAFTLKKTTGAKFLIPIPSFLVRPFFGESTQILTNSQNAVPKLLEQHGFKFNYTNLIHALYTEFNYENVTIEKYIGENTETDLDKKQYGIQKLGQFQLSSDIVLKQDSETIFLFFSSPLNLGLLMPRWVDFRIMEIPDQIESGSYIKYRIGLRFVGLKWTTKIIRWEPNKLFIDWQAKGPYSLWWHEHIILENNDGTVTMRDRIIYSIPFWILGKLAHKILIKNTLLRIIRFRNQAIGLKF